MNINSTTQRFLGLVFRYAPFLLYMLWVVIGYRILIRNRASQPPHFRYVATSDLPTNHLIHTEDIMVDASLPWRDRVWLPKQSEFEGRYVAQKIYLGQSVKLSNLRPSPVMTPSAGNVVYLFSLQHQPFLEDVLNTDSVVGICTTKCSDYIRVLAVLCAPLKKTDCSVGFDLSPKQLEFFSDPAKVQLFLK